MKKKVFAVISIAVLASGCLFGCAGKNSVGQIPTGIYSYTMPDGQKVTLTVRKDSIVMQDPTGSAYENMKLIYCFRKLQSAVQESNLEGVSLSEEEKQNLIQKYENEIDFSVYDGKELQYTTEFFEDDMSVNIYAMENGEEIIGYQMTYFPRENRISYNETEFLNFESELGDPQ